MRYTLPSECLFLTAYAVFRQPPAENATLGQLVARGQKNAHKAPVRNSFTTCRTAVYLLSTFD